MGRNGGKCGRLERIGRKLVKRDGSKRENGGKGRKKHKGVEVTKRTPKRGNSTGESEMKVNENIGRVKGIVQGGAEREVERRSRERRIGDQIEGDNIENEGE